MRADFRFPSSSSPLARPQSPERQVVRLLDQGKIPYQRVGCHRRVTLADLKAFDDMRRRERREHLQRLVELSERYGLYERDDQAMPLLAAQRERDRRGE